MVQEVAIPEKRPGKGRRWDRIIFSLAVLAIGLFFLWRVRAVLLPFLLGLTLAYLLKPLVNYLIRRRFSRVTSILLVYLGSLFALLVMASYALPALIGELDEILLAIPRLTSQAEWLIDIFYSNYHRVPLPDSVRLVLDQRLEGMEKLFTYWASSALQGILSFLSQTWSLVLAPLLAFYFLKDAESIGKRLSASLPVGRRSELLHLWGEIDCVLMKFVQGHLLVAFLVGVLSGAGLFILGVKYALLLGIISGLAELIPYFGPILGALPAVALAYLETPRLAFYTILFMLAVQQVEANFLSPRILGDSVGLHPLVVIFAVLAGGYLYGLVGMLLAVPVAAVLHVLICYYFGKMVAD